MKGGTIQGWHSLSLLLTTGLVACGGGMKEEAAPATSAREVTQARESSLSAAALRWGHHLTGPEEESGKLVNDRDGGSLAVVNFTGSFDVGGTTVVAPGGPASRAMALVRYDALGRPQVEKVFDSVYGLHHAVDSNRDILLVISAEGGGIGTGPLAQGQYLVKLDPRGRLRWLRPLPPSDIRVEALVTDRDDNIGLGGYDVDTTGNALSTFTKLTPEGAPLWTFLDTEALQSHGAGATVDEEGNFVLCGNLAGDFGPEPFVLMLSPEGQLRWHRRLKGAIGFALRAATHGNRVVVVGTFARSFTFAGSTHTATPNGWIEQDAFVIALTRAGEDRWAWNFAFNINDVAMDEQDGVTVAGGYQAGSGDLGVLGPLPGNTETVANLYVAKFDRIDGHPRWVRGFPTGLDRHGVGIDGTTIAVTKEGRPTVLGALHDTFTVGSEVWTAQGYSDLFLLGFAP